VVSPGRTELFTARRVHTFASEDPGAADGVLVTDGIITAVGRAADLRGAARRVVDLGDAVLTPGLTDVHIHLIEWAFARRAVDLSRTTSPEAAADAVAASQDGGIAWLRGRGWNQHRWGERRPHRRLLDRLLPPDRPAVLMSQDMHALWVNSAALAAAGITAATPDPPGGRIERDAEGEPTGILYEYASPLVISRLPAPDADLVLDAVAEAQRALHHAGITAVHSFPGIHIPQPVPLAVCERLRSEDRLRLRVLQHLPIEDIEAAAAVGLRSGFGGDWIRVGAAKLFLDGALGSRTAWMRLPYEGSADHGIRILEPASFRSAVARAAAAGFACTVHAIGDAAVALALDVLTEPELQVAALPHRIEHVQCMPLERAADFKGVVCSVQPAHLLTDWPAVDRHWGEQRACGTYAFATLLASGAILAFGSDAPVEPIDPRRGLHAALLRTGLDREPAGGWQAQERISRREAWLGFTTGPARAARWDDRLGCLAPGRFADFAAWDRDPLSCHDDELLDMRCVATIVGGEQVHSA
jgi:predicted amidohydrolase YtcJ